MNKKIQGMEAAAIAAFRTPPLSLNCAQSVIHAHVATHAGCQLKIEDFRNLGGGKAPDGMCGALWAACALRPANAKEMQEAFRSTAGALRCRSLKRDRGYPCRKCVTLAVRLSVDHVNFETP